MKNTKVLETELSDLRLAYPSLPSDYIAYLGSVGWGETASGRMVYSGPISPQEIYGENFGKTNIVLLGDDLSGYCFGYDLSNSSYGEFTPSGEWQASTTAQGFEHYVGT